MAGTVLRMSNLRKVAAPCIAGTPPGSAGTLCFASHGTPTGDLKACCRTEQMSRSAHSRGVFDPDPQAHGITPNSSHLRGSAYASAAVQTQLILHTPTRRHDRGQDQRLSGPSASLAAEALVDPVCGMSVSLQSQHRLEHEGRSYYFCAAGCRKKFAADPAAYLQPGLVNPSATPSPPIAPAASAGASYTCPMHPEIRQDRPGACPKCGMALEPVLPALDDGDNP